jgi:hypothetical protein
MNPDPCSPEWQERFSVLLGGLISALDWNGMRWQAEFAAGDGSTSPAAEHERCSSYDTQEHERNVSDSFVPPTAPHR